MPFRCDVCGQNDFKSEAGMKGHKTKMHSKNKEFPAHGGIPEGKFTCEICGKNDFKSESSMKGHKTKMHSKDKGFQAQEREIPEDKFTCEICGKNDFKSEASMKGHKIKFHSNDKGFPAHGGIPEGKFTCEICGKNDFKSESSMKGHKTKMHSNDKGIPSQGGEIPDGKFTCDVCGKNDFKSESSMRGHKTKMHSKDKGFQAQEREIPEDKFTCEICGKNDFKSEASMKGHKIKFHSNDKGFPAPGVIPEGKFTCEICGKTGFKSEARMKGHKTEMHSNDKVPQGQEVNSVCEFTCNVCGQNNFATAASMKGHKTRVHGKEIVKQAAIPCKEVMKENCIKVKNESPTASGSLCEATPSSVSYINPHIISNDDQQTKVSSPAPRLNNPGGYLSQRMEGAQLRLIDINIAAGIVRDFIEGDRGVRKKLNDNGGGFRWDILTSGSYYDKTKNMSPDEFDFMISPMNLDAYMKWDKAMPKGFCKIGLTRTNRSELMTGGYLDPVKFKDMAFKLFGDAATRRNVKSKRFGDHNVSPGTGVFRDFLKLSLCVEDHPMKERILYNYF
ncbi:Zinc finger and BTB domain-containing protein 49 [Mizuhopecten yessoensis]|uniref:Zinc finger and BTB domain-containing protein 49 n=1 Tax=Mizuhopecten yessoensis TaxID=6573 RepID=A0A210Q7L9_MIZYE|nr:Zinc finger and BTB domain-containing protein 49 [Mizuhopecten yessoensis]